MGRKSSLVWIGVAVAVLGLIAANVALREDAEPDFGPIASDRPPRDPAPVHAQLEEETHAEPPAEEASAAEPSEPAEEPPAAAEEERIGCDNPFVPSRVGDWRRYVWRQSGEDRSAELRLDAISERELPEGDREITWQAQVTASDDSSSLARAELTTRCTAGHSAEEPWFGILERSLGLRLTDSPDRWRWPVRLREGDRFEGTAQFDPSGADMRVPSGVDGPQILRVTRRHVVGAREAIEVPAGRYRAWRVDYEEQQAFGPRGEHGTGTIWVAPNAGMVRSQATNAENVVQTIELVGLGHVDR
jgi:hypothetical protein